MHYILRCWDVWPTVISVLAQAWLHFHSRPSLQMEPPVISSISFHQCQRRARLSPWHENTHAHWGVHFVFYTVWRESSWHQGWAGRLRSSYLESMLNGALTSVWLCCQTSQPRLTSRGTRGRWWLLRLMAPKKEFKRPTGVYFSGMVNSSSNQICNPIH